MATHVSDLFIETYRGIRNLDIKNLSDINIITGDNNCGKTSVLELISSLESPDDIRMWSGIRSFGRFSGWTWSDRLETLFDIDKDNKYISYSFTAPNSKESPFHIRLSLIKERVTVSKQERKLETVKLRENVILDRFDEDEMDEIDTDRNTYNIYINNKKIKSVIIYGLDKQLAGRDKSKHKFFGTQYISPVAHADGVMYLDEVLNNLDLYQEMLQILREFDPDIISINSVGSGNLLGRPVYKILSNSHNSALPLNVYGDGMKKAILLISAVVKAKNGILLLDEFETAIHTTAMSKVFSWILHTCKKLDVQLFLTSHSQEAINKLLKCSPELHHVMRLVTLYKKENKTVARVLDGREAIETQDDLGLELR